MDERMADPTTLRSYSPTPAQPSGGADGTGDHRAEAPGDLPLEGQRTGQHEIVSPRVAKTSKSYFFGSRLIEYRK